MQKHWKKLPREAVAAPGLLERKKRLAVALGCRWARGEPGAGFAGVPASSGWDAVKKVCIQTS